MGTSLKPSDFIDKLILGVSFLLVVYTLLMAFFSDITYDEAYTYTNYCIRTKPNFLAFDVANNHPLNSFLVYLFSFLTPYREFAMRLPNILFLMVYLIGVIRIAKEYISSKLLVYGAFVLFYFLVPNFFSQARGYGIATSLVLIFLMRFSKTSLNHRHVIHQLYLLLFASAAFTGLLPFVFVVVVYYLFFDIKKNLTSFIKSYYADLFILLLGFSWLLTNLIIVSSAGNPIYGSTNDFFSATIGSYLTNYFHFSPDFIKTLTPVLTCLYLILCFTGLIIDSRKSKITLLTLATFILLFTASSFLGRPYITGRLLLPFFPLVILSIVESTRNISRKFTISNSLITKMSIFFFGLLCFNFGYKMSVTNIFTHRGNEQKEVFEHLYVKTPPANVHSTIPFYLKKLQLYPPAETIKNDTTFLSFELSNQVKGYYSSHKSILLLESGHEYTRNIRCHFAISKDNTQWVHATSFIWHRKKTKYHLLYFPPEEFNYFKIGYLGTRQKRIEKVIQVSP